MIKWKNHWKELRPYEKCCEVAFWVCPCLALMVISFEILSLTGVLKITFDALFIPGALLAVGSVCGAVSYWRLEHNFAVLLRGSAVLFGISVIWDIVKLFIF